MGPAAGLLCACCGLPTSSSIAALAALLGLAAGADTIAAAEGDAVETCVQGSASDPAVQEIIRKVFGGRHARSAIRIALCESGTDGTRARTGRFRGLFQMDPSARRRYGHGSCAAEQVRAAHRYFLDSGRRWTAWGSCRRKAD